MSLPARIAIFAGRIIGALLIVVAVVWLVAMSTSHHFSHAHSRGHSAHVESSGPGDFRRS